LLPFTTLTFVTPAFNAERLIDQCIEQVLQCVQVGDEVIVDDDVCQDGTGRQLAGWAEKARWSGMTTLLLTPGAPRYHRRHVDGADDAAYALS
jgi:glycosyltransferase involved in cell wall biosynthesis